MTSEKDENPMFMALQNHLIVREIFKFLPMESLLNWSLASKGWNSKIRTYIRDYRKCTVSIQSSQSRTPCDRLAELEKVLSVMTTIIPFNSVQIVLEVERFEIPASGGAYYYRASHIHDSKSGDPEGLSCTNVFTKLNLKFLSVSWKKGAITGCPINSIISRLFLEKGSEIKFLNLGKISPFFVKLFAGKKLDFPNLEVIENSHGFNDREGFLRKVIDAAPNLKKIVHNGNLRILQILPEDKYRLLTNLDFMTGTEVLAYLGMKLSRFQPPALSELTLGLLSNVRQNELEKAFQTAQLLLKSSRRTLKKLDVTGEDLIKEIMSPFLDHPAEKLMSLSLSKAGIPEEMLLSLQQLDFPRLLPKLTKFVLDIYPMVIGGQYPAVSIPAGSNEEEWVISDVPNSAKTVSSLLVAADIRCLSFLTLRQLFPEVAELSLYPNPKSAHAIPYGKIFKLWPNLRTFSVEEEVQNQLPNCDAEFCGIHPEEVELLWRMKTEDLERLHVVPIRPCVLTMPNLDRLKLHLSLAYDQRFVPKGRRYEFLSDVTKFLVFKRMPWLSVDLDLK